MYAAPAISPIETLINFTYIFNQSRDLLFPIKLLSPSPPIYASLKTYLGKQMAILPVVLVPRSYAHPERFPRKYFFTIVTFNLSG